MIPDFFALRAFEIFKTFEIRSFFSEKWLLSHVLAGHKVSYILVCASTTSIYETFDPGIIITINSAKNKIEVIE